MWKPLWKEKKFVVRPQQCIGCRSCELACSWRQAGRVDLGSAAISVYQSGGATSIVPMLCMQCDEPECLKACPNQAISKDEQSGVVAIDDSKCIRCNTCLHACPFGNIRNSVALGRQVKCDQCGGDPQCQKYCPVGAIDFVDSDDISVETMPL